MDRRSQSPPQRRVKLPPASPMNNNKPTQQQHLITRPTIKELESVEFRAANRARFGGEVLRRDVYNTKRAMAHGKIKCLCNLCHCGAHKCPRPPYQTGKFEAASTYHVDFVQQPFKPAQVRWRSLGVASAFFFFSFICVFEF